MVAAAGTDFDGHLGVGAGELHGRLALPGHGRGLGLHEHATHRPELLERLARRWPRSSSSSSSTTHESVHADDNTTTAAAAAAITIIIYLYIKKNNGERDIRQHPPVVVVRRELLIFVQVATMWRYLLQGFRVEALVGLEGDGSSLLLDADAHDGTVCLCARARWGMFG